MTPPYLPSLRTSSATVRSRPGLLFIALILPYVIGGPIAGWWVDKKGPKPAAVFGFGYLVLSLILLRLAQPGGQKQVIIFCVLLSLNGVGLAIIGSPSIVEASYVVGMYDKTNPDFFGANGPWAQLYGLNSMFFCAGLAVGPVISGGLKDTIGYGNMNLVVSTLPCSCSNSLTFPSGRHAVLDSLDTLRGLHWRHSKYAEGDVAECMTCRLDSIKSIVLPLSNDKT